MAADGSRVTEFGQDADRPTATASRPEAQSHGGRSADRPPQAQDAPWTDAERPDPLDGPGLPGVLETVVRLTGAPLLLLTAAGPRAGQIVWAGPAVCALTGRTDLTGQVFSALLAPDSRGSFLRGLERMAGAAGRHRADDLVEGTVQVATETGLRQVRGQAVVLPEQAGQVEHLLVRLDELTDLEAPATGRTEVGRTEAGRTEAVRGGPVLYAVPAPRGGAPVPVPAPTPAPRLVRTRPGQSLHPARSRTLPRPDPQ